MCAGLGQELGEGDAELRRAVEDLHGAEGVDVDIRHAGLHGVEEVQIEGTGKIGVDTALHADLARAEFPRLLGAVGHLGERERVGLAVLLSLRERAEAAAHVADVREVDVAVDHVGDLVADGLGPQVVGDMGEGLERGPLGGEQRQGLPVGDGAVGGRLREGALDVGVEALGGTSRAAHSRVTSRASKSPYTCSASSRSPAPAAFANVRAISRGFHRTSGSCQAIGVGTSPSAARPSGPSEGLDGRPHLRREVRVGAGGELRVDREALPQAQASRGGRGGEMLDGRPGLLRVHVVGGERGDTAPVVDAGVQQTQALGLVGQVGGRLDVHAGPHHDPSGRDGGEERVGVGLGRVVHGRAWLRAEVLHDDLLHVAVAPMDVADRDERLGALARGLPDPDEDAGRERDREAAGVGDGAHPHRRHLVR